MKQSELTVKELDDNGAEAFFDECDDFVDRMLRSVNSCSKKSKINYKDYSIKIINDIKNTISSDCSAVICEKTLLDKDMSVFHITMKLVLELTLQVSDMSLKGSMPKPQIKYIHTLILLVKELQTYLAVKYSINEEAILDLHTQLSNIFWKSNDGLEPIINFN